MLATRFERKFELLARYCDWFELNPKRWRVRILRDELSELRNDVCVLLERLRSNEQNGQGGTPSNNGNGIAGNNGS
jgi:hypothetical protein